MYPNNILRLSTLSEIKLQHKINVLSIGYVYTLLPSSCNLHGEGDGIFSVGLTELVCLQKMCTQIQGSCHAAGLTLTPGRKSMDDARQDS